MVIDEVVGVAKQLCEIGMDEEENCGKQVKERAERRVIKREQGIVVAATTAIQF